MAIGKQGVRNFDNDTYVQHMMQAAIWASMGSNDPTRKVGCAITMSRGEADQSFQALANVPLLGIGCNTIPCGLDEASALESKNDVVVHAEAAAVANMASMWRKECDTRSAFITRMPCVRCAATLVEAGVRQIHFLTHTNDANSKWIGSFAQAISHLRAKGIELYAITIMPDDTLEMVDLSFVGNYPDHG